MNQIVIQYPGADASTDALETALKSCFLIDNLRIRAGEQHVLVTYNASYSSLEELGGFVKGFYFGLTGQDIIYKTQGEIQ